MGDLVDRLEARAMALTESAAMSAVRQTVEWQAAERIDELQEALRQIVNWADSYPLDIFPEPDFKKAAQVLKDNGMTLDAISASNMRHVVSGVGDIARAALRDE